MKLRFLNFDGQDIEALRAIFHVLGRIASAEIELVKISVDVLLRFVIEFQVLLGDIDG